MSYKKVNKTTAKNMYNQGYTVYLVPCKCAFDFDAHWVRPIPINNSNDGDFDSSVNAFIAYNCNRELGKYPHYYV